MVPSRVWAAMNDFSQNEHLLRIVLLRSPSRSLGPLTAIFRLPHAYNNESYLLLLLRMHANRAAEGNSFPTPFSGLCDAMHLPIRTSYHDYVVFYLRRAFLTRYAPSQATSGRVRLRPLSFSTAAADQRLLGALYRFQFGSPAFEMCTSA